MGEAALFAAACEAICGEAGWRMRAAHCGLRAARCDAGCGGGATVAVDRTGGDAARGLRAARGGMRRRLRWGRDGGGGSDRR
jgi:hypothetical protein